MQTEPAEIHRRKQHRQAIAKQITELRNTLSTIPRAELNNLARLIITTEQVKSIRPRTVLAEAEQLHELAHYQQRNANWHKQNHSTAIINTRPYDHMQRTAQELLNWATRHNK